MNATSIQIVIPAQRHSVMTTLDRVPLFANSGEEASESRWASSPAATTMAGRARVKALTAVCADSIQAPIQLPSRSP